ncbi:MAG: ABC transporter ATP-binding protein [Anaerolineae bacterium]|nr:ABC transporter ATP-binding protein [Anaerolineae bacterium]
MPKHPEIARTEDNFDVRATISHNRLKGMWRLMTGFRTLYVGAVIALAISALATTGSLLLLRYLIDDVLSNSPENLLQKLVLTALGFIVLSFVRGGFAFLSGSSAAAVSEGVALRLKDFMFDHLQHLKFTYHDTMQTGELIQRSTSDINAIRLFVAEQAIGVGRILLLFIVNFAALLMLNVPLALFSVMVVPLVFVMSLFFFGKVSKAYERFQEQDERVNNTLQENLSGVRVVKAFARQEYEIERFETENKEKYRRGIDFMLLHSMYWPVVDFLTGFQMIGTFFLGALMVMEGEGNVLFTVGPLTFVGISLGTYISFAAMVGWIINPMRNLGRLIVQMSTGMVSYDRVAEIFSERWEDLGKGEKPPVEDVTGNIVFENLNFTYEQGSQVLYDISFEVQAGQTIALLGSTGSGKTTLLTLLTRFYNYHDGSIKLDGVELNQYPRYFLREKIGVVEQEPFLFSRTIRENITYGLHREVTDEEVLAATRAAAVHDVIQEFSNGYNTMVGERGVTLSGGQKQRVALARTLLKNPPILVLDDATSSVDTQTESEIRDALGKMMTQRTSFIIAHRIQSVMNADLILVFDKGRIAQRGTHDELMAVDGIYRRTYDMQARIEDELEKEITSV